MRISRLYKLTSVVLMVTLLLFTVAPLQVAFAAPLLDKSDTMTSLKTSTVSDHSIVFRTPSGVGTSTDTMTITFPAGFDMGSVAHGDMTLDHSAGSQASCDSASFINSETLAASAGAGEWGVDVTGQVITLTPPTDASDTIATDACVRVNIGDTNKITNPDTADDYSIAIAGTFGDAGDILIVILDDDQVLITATVDEILTFTISDNEIGFGTLSASAARYATGDGNGSDTETGAHTLVAGTNAVGGYAVTTIGNTLTYGSSTVSAIGGTNTASSAGSEQFGLRMTASSGIGTVTAPFAAAGFAFQADTLQEVASATGPSADTTYSVRYLANIASDTPAGPYSAALTYVATATF